MTTLRTFEDAFNLLCHEKIGSGIHRDVFECRIRDDLVVKVETGEDFRNFANVLEDRFFADWSYHEPVAKWLAPIRYLSPDGRIMLQDRCDPIKESDLPDELPAFLTDIKANNFGRLNGRIVCVDYAYTIRSASARLKKWK